MSPLATPTLPLKAAHLLRSFASNPEAASAAASDADPLVLDHDLAWIFHHENILGTSMQLSLRTGARTAGQSSVAAAALVETAVLATIDRATLILSSWNAASEVSQWLTTRNQPTRVSSELFEVLALFDHWRAATLGALNPAAEAAARLWHQAAAELRIPTAAELADAARDIRQIHWQLDPAKRPATHLTATPLALASFTKSYIADRAANAALAAGASGVMLNIGGDIVVRGDLAQPVAIANPLADAENDAPIDRVLIRDRAIATSGSYRRSIASATTLSSRPEATLSSPQQRDLQQVPPLFSHLAASHIIDPRTASPTGHILSSTVIAADPSTAGALATAFSVLTPAESHAVAQSVHGAEYLLVTQSGERITSPGWQSYQIAALRPASYSAPQSGKPAPAAATWPANFELAINLEIAQANDFRSRRPYVAVWVENEDHYPVRTIALWYQRDRWLPELHSWYHDDQLRFRMEGHSIAETTSSATRPPGKYSLKWDGKDDHGNLVKAGKYTVFIEAAREHGGYDLMHQELDVNTQPQQHTFAPGHELGAVTLDYNKQ